MDDESFIAESRYKQMLAQLGEESKTMAMHEVSKIAEDIWLKQESFEESFSELTSVHATVAGVYSSQWSSPWLSALFNGWNEKVKTSNLTVAWHTNAEDRAQKEVLRCKVYINDDGKLVVYLRQLVVDFPFILTVETGRRIYRTIDVGHAVIKCDAWEDTIYVTMRPIPFTSVDELCAYFSDLFSSMVMSEREYTTMLKQRLVEEESKRKSALERMQKLEENKLKAERELKALQDRIRQLNNPPSPSVPASNRGLTLMDVHGNEDAKRELVKLMKWPNINPGLIASELGAASKGILLYGPPGNGKTMLVKAIANETKMKFELITAASILDKWMGNSEKNVKELFERARKNQPSIIFIDEIDALLSSRKDSDSEASMTAMKTQFFNEMDGALTSASDRVYVVGATKCPTAIDEAARRRLPKRVFVMLPDEAARAGVLKRLLDDSCKKYIISASEFSELATLTDYYSYSDLNQLYFTAIENRLWELGEAKLKVTLPQDLRPLVVADFKQALSKCSRSIDVPNYMRLLELHENGLI